jgi:hypothetical protein
MLMKKIINLFSIIIFVYSSLVIAEETVTEQIQRISLEGLNYILKGQQYLPEDVNITQTEVKPKMQPNITIRGAQESVTQVIEAYLVAINFTLKYNPQTADRSLGTVRREDRKLLNCQANCYFEANGSRLLTTDKRHTIPWYYSCKNDQNEIITPRFLF